MNNWITQNITYGQTFLETVVSALKTVPGGPLVASGKLRLSQDPAFGPTPQSTISALAANEATYTGYTAGGVAVVLTVGLLLGTDAVGAEAGGVFVMGTAGTLVPNSIYGYWIDDGTNVIAYEAFGAGNVANFAATGDFLVLTVLLALAFSQAAA